MGFGPISSTWHHAGGFQSHMKSKSHLAAAKRHGIFDDPLEQLDNIVLAASCRHGTEETETHRERTERFRQVRTLRKEILELLLDDESRLICCQPTRFDTCTSSD